VKQSRRSCKTPAKLSKTAVRRLNSYALAAGAAAAGALALAHPAEAKIVYTPAHLVIVSNPTGIYNLDLNHDGVNDFAIRDMTFNTGDFIHGALSIDPFGKNAVEGKGFVYALRRGALIGSKQPFSAPQTMTNCVLAATRSLTCFGSWHEATNRYLGLKFHVDGKVHYGWARLSVMTNIAGITATLTGYAYETIPNKGIIAGQTKGTDDSRVEQLNPASLTQPVPEPATLGMLALGSPGQSIWRREEDAAAGQ
jgi:hypothetical protein